MAKKRLPQPIKWNEDSNARLKKEVSAFNSRVKKLRKARKNVSYLPDEVSFRETKKLITTEEELEAVLESLKGFKGKEAYKKVTLKSGEQLTTWEYGELKKQQAIAKKRIKKQMEKVERPYGKMGTAEFQRLNQVYNSIRNFEKLKGARLEVAKSRLANYGSTDFDMRRAIIYKENYLKMIKETFSNEPKYKKLVHKIKQIHPLTLYDDLKAGEFGDKIKDISFMYDFGGLAEFEDLVDKFLDENEEGE